MQPDLFTPCNERDPGGKVRTALPKNMRGQASFYGENKEYRLYLTRVWGPRGEEKWPLLIGMNPLTATAEYNDPTVSREIGFAQSWGYEGMCKANALDYRATNPRDLLAPGVIARSEANLPTILSLANDADKIVLCYGVIPKPLQWAADELIRELRGADHALWCFGRTLLGHPRHPLYLRSDTPLERFK